MKRSIRIIISTFVLLVAIFSGSFSYAQEDATTLETWTDFNAHLWLLAWGLGNIETIQKTSEPFDLTCLENETCFEISAAGEVNKVYARYETSDKTIYYYTNASNIYFNPLSAGMFSQFTWLTYLDMTGLDTSKVTSMAKMFNWCSKLKKLDLKKWDTSNVTDMSNMFNGCSALTTLDVSKFNTNKVTNMSSMFKSCWKIKTLNMSKWKTSNVTDMSNMFNGCSSLTAIDVSKFNTSKVTNMSSMFNWCNNTKLTTIDVSKFDTSKVESMEKMFNQCNNLTTLDVSGFNTSEVTNMSSMFNGCSKLTGLDLSKFDTSKVTSMEKMFNKCSWLKNLDLSKFDTSKVTSMQSMFNECWNLTELDLSNFTTNWLKNMNSMFYKCWSLKELNLSGWDTSNVTDMNQLFKECGNLIELDLTMFNTSNVNRMDWMFWWDSSLTTIYASESFLLNGITSSSDMFKGAISLIWWSGTKYNEQNVDWTYAVIDQWEDHPWYFSIKNKESIFLPWEKFNAKIKSLANLTSMAFNNVDSEIISITRSYEKPQIDNLEILSIIWAKNPIYARYDSGTIFYYTESKEVYINPNSKSMFQWLSKLENIDFREVYTDNVTDMNNMFNGCESLESLDLKNFDTSSVSDMKYMFNNCKLLKNLNLESFDTSNVTNMERMFNGCESLESLDLKIFDTSKVTKMNYMFSYCKSLQTVNFDENFDTTNVINMRNMFSNCESLEILNIEYFDTSNVVNVNQMFNNATGLKTIYVSDKFDTTSFTWTTIMFLGDVSLVWWNGTTYDSTQVDLGYARIDGKDGLSWYFTDIMDMEYSITYNLDGWIISWEKTTYTQRDSFTLPIPAKEWYDFIWWTWSNLENLEVEVVIPEKTRWDLEYTANWIKAEKKSDDKYSWWWGSKSSQTQQSTEDNETKTNEKEYNDWKPQWDNIENYNSDYSLEENEAYQFAYNNWITTMPSVVKANMNGPLNRISMAKMLSNYAINILWKKPSNLVVPKFSDVTQELDDDYWGAVSLSYQLWIMWININKFRPFDVVTRWEFATALSRMLFGISDGETLYYEPHIKKLFEEKIISITNPNLKELRWYVMIMLMRSAKNE